MTVTTISGYNSHNALKSRQISRILSAHHVAIVAERLDVEDDGDHDEGNEADLKC